MRSEILHLFTIGHSTRPIEEFIEALEAHSVRKLIDVRTVPGSRRNPQFGEESLRQSLAAAGIDYLRLQKLGGLRRTKKDSRNTGWRNLSFRGYADHMQTPEFQEGLNELMALAKKDTVAIMCAEAVPWRCHRSLIADALTVKGHEVLHIMSPSKASAHRLTPFLRVMDGEIIYPEDGQPPLL